MLLRHWGLWAQDFRRNQIQVQDVTVKIERSRASRSPSETTMEMCLSFFGGRGALSLGFGPGLGENARRTLTSSTTEAANPRNQANADKGHYIISGEVLLARALKETGESPTPNPEKSYTNTCTQHLSKTQKPEP